MKSTLYPILLGLIALPLAGQKFYPDDPLTAEPPPLPIEAVNFRSLNPLYEILRNVFKPTSQPMESPQPVAAQGLNTLGEVMDGPWYVNRHTKSRMSLDQLRAGPGMRNPPDSTKKWRVLAVRKYEERPGLLIADSTNALYLISFDPKGSLELTTGAAMVSSRLMYAMGYHTPELYLVHFGRTQLIPDEEGQNFNAVGKLQRLTDDDVDLFLESVPREASGGYRALAIRVPPGATLVGPFEFFGRRTDDPNDIIPHEHRRELRGLHVISSWIANNWINATQTVDATAPENGITSFRHYFVEFTTTLGSGFRRPKNAREGNEPVFNFKQTVKNVATFGIYAPAWQRADMPDLPAVGYFESEAFEPSTWTPNIAVPALVNRLRDDNYWATKRVVAFTDEEIRAIVSTGEYSDPRVSAWIADSLIQRRDKIGRFYTSFVLPLENFRIQGGNLLHDDLAVEHGYRGARPLKYEWFSFNNISRQRTAVAQSGPPEQVPPRILTAESGYYGVTISSPENDFTLTVYFSAGRELRVVGMEHDWPGRPSREVNLAVPTALPNTYSKLGTRQKELFDRYTMRYNQQAGRSVGPEAFYAGLSMSERTTFEAVTHALTSTPLTDASGQSLGVAFDLVTDVNRIAGQYLGRTGDEQFRLYVSLRPDTKDVLERSQQFHFGHENTVYHAGYAQSYRQDGGVPNIQFSIAEDGLRADIDVDYRASKTPQSLWNGHLTASNSDVRAGENYKAHEKRWGGLANWWQSFFGNLPEIRPVDNPMVAKQTRIPTPLPPNRPPGAAIPNIQDAAQEFLTDWLVRHNYDEALSFVSSQSLACVQAPQSNTTKSVSLNANEARRQLRENIKAIAEKLGHADSLTAVIEPVLPWRAAFKAVDQPFSGEFAVVRAPDAFAKAFTCMDRSDAAVTAALDNPNPVYGNSYGVIFRFVGETVGGVIGILWEQENGRWVVKSWKIYDE